MSLKKITIGDRAVTVDEARYNAFDAALTPQTPLLLGVSGRDAGEAMAFVVSQLAYTEAQVFERLYQPMQYEQLIPITNEAGEWADSIRYEIYDYAGRGKRHSGKGHDINLVDVAFADKTFPVVNGAIGYDYTAEELRRTAFLRRPISERKLAAAIDGYRRHMNDVGLFGEQNLTGLFNNPNVPHGNAPNGAWMTTNAANPDKIRADVNTLIRTIWAATQYNDMPDVVAIAPAQYGFISETPLSATFPMKTILQWLKENNLAKTERNVDIEFVPGYGLDTAGVGGVTRMMGYVKNPTRLVMHIPLPLRFLAPQLIGLSVQVPGEYKYSGVEFRYPKSAYYMDGI